MAVSGLDHFNIVGSAGLVEVLKGFYVETLGLDVGYRPPFGSRGYWLYARGRAVLHLSVTETGGDDGAADTGRFGHIALSCDDLAGMVQRLRARDVAFTVQKVPLTGQTQVFLTDPAGIGVELNFPAGDPPPGA